MFRKVDILILITLILFLGHATLYAQKGVRFDQLSVSQGLSSNLVHSITQDSMGFMWIGTGSGLNRYDGKICKRFLKSQYPSLLRNDIRTLYTFSDGSVVMGSFFGCVLQYNPKTEEFTNLKPTDFDSTYYKQIVSFSETKEGKKYLNTSSGFYLYDSQEKRFCNRFPAYSRIKDTYILSLFEDNFDRFWICSFNSVIVIDKKGNEIYRFDLSNGGNKQTATSKFTILSDSHILVSCFSDLIHSFELDSQGNIAKVTEIKAPFSGLNNIMRDRNGHFWYTSDGFGLWYSEDFPTSKEDFVKVVSVGDKKMDFSKIYCILEAENGDIWIGTQAEGVLKFNPNIVESVVFSNYLAYPYRISSSFTETADGQLYVASDGEGFCRMNPERMEYRLFSEKDGLSNKNVVEIASDINGDVWIATWGGGIYCYSPKKDKIEKVTFSPLNSNLNCFISIATMSNGEVWAASGGDGLYVKDSLGKWSKRVLSFSPGEDDMWPSGVVEGKQNVRWINTSRSLWWVKGDEARSLMGDFSKQMTHVPIAINNMMCDNQYNLWVATNQCLLRFSSDGTKCDTIKSVPIQEYTSVAFDGKNSMVVTSSTDVYYINCKTLEAQKLLYDFSSIGMSGFNLHGNFISSSGVLFCSTSNGFVMIKPEEENQKDSLRYLSISSVHIQKTPLSKSVDYCEWNEKGDLSQITLPYNLAELSLCIDLVDYSKHTPELDYRLIGLTGEWDKVGNNRTIYFPYLPPGDYILEIQASKKGNDKYHALYTLPIVVTPPWWQTWWFRLLFVSILALIIGSFLYLRFRRLLKQKVMLEQMVKERTKELDEKNVLIESQNEELKQVLFDKDRLISVLAHDLKNPMFAIVGALEGWLKREADLGKEERRGIISSALSSAQSLQDELIRLLEWARAKSEKIECTPQSLDFRSSLQNVVSLLSGVINKKNLHFTSNLNIEHCVVVDPRMLRAILRNILNNAIKFTHSGGNISVTAYEEDRDMVIDIKDSGVGMDENQIASLLSGKGENSSKGTENESGTGLGFRICLDYVKRNKGTIAIESEKGNGTLVRLRLPLSDEKLSDDIEMVDEEIQHVVDKELLGGNVVMVVDDDPLISKNIKMILEPYMQVHVANDGREGLELAKKYSFDLVLSDVEMPIMNGIEMCKQLLKDEKNSGLPILFLSAKSEQSDRLLGLISGAVDYVPKPFNTNELLLKLTNILINRRKQQQRLLNIRLMSGASEVPEKTTEEKINPLLEQIIDVVAKNYQDSEFSIEKMASLLFVSQSTLIRRSKSIIGKTPIEVLNEYRLNKAKGLLMSARDEMSVADIAFEVGFSDPAYFTRKYKDFFGFTPSETPKS